MPHLTEETKVLENIETSLLCALPKLASDLISRGLHVVEKRVRELMQEMGDLLMGSLLQRNAAQFCDEHQSPKGSKNSFRMSTVRLSSGKRVRVKSPYYGRLPKGYAGGRRPWEEHLNIRGGNSPLLCDQVGYTAMLTPSYSLGTQQLNKFGVSIGTSSVRSVTQQLADRCQEAGEANILIGEGESVAGKSVVISTDGGRTRTRQSTGKCNEAGNEKYDTPWREPKLFVIDILDGGGGIDRKELPLYGCRFDEGEMIELLSSYLKKLKIHKAVRVQLIADGAVWIWNRLPALLEELGVEKDRITQTLDHYHALEHFHALIKAMPRRIGKKAKELYIDRFKSLIWEGKTEEVVKELRGIFLRPNKEVKRDLNYLTKHAHRMQYADYEASGLMCGSGLMESAVRRIINLRFKNAATFWCKENVEKLYFLRGALLAKRWDIVMTKLQNFKP